MKRSKRQNRTFYIPQSGIGNQRGIALVMVLVLSAIGLALMTTLIYLITSGTQVSGIQKRYKTALDAGMGGKDVVLQVISMKDKSNTDINNVFSQLSLAGVTAVSTTPVECTDLDGKAPAGLLTKLRASTSRWSANCDQSLAIDPATNTTYDMRFELGVTAKYIVYAKIVNTVEGSAVGENTGLRGSGVVTNQGDAIQVAGIPNLYTIEVEAENKANPQEKAKLQVLYLY